MPKEELLRIYIQLEQIDEIKSKKRTNSEDKCQFKFEITVTKQKDTGEIVSQFSNKQR